MKHSAIKKAMALALSFVLMLLPLENILAAILPARVQVAPLAQALKGKIDSGDVIVSEKARKGLPVKLILTPKDYDAGFALPAIPAAVLSAYLVIKAVDSVVGNVNIGLDVAAILTSKHSQSEKMQMLGSLILAKGVDKLVLDKIPFLPVKTKEIAIALSDMPLNEKLFGIGKGMLLNAVSLSGLAGLMEREVKTLTIESQKSLATLEYEAQDFGMGALDDLMRDSGPISNSNELLKNAEFANDLSDWQHENAFVSSSFGPIVADHYSSLDNSFAVAHTGWGDQSTRGYLEQPVNVPMSRTGAFSMLYNFVTTEYPTFQGSEFNDYFKLTLSGPSGELVTKIDYLNSSNFQSVSGLPASILDQTTGGQTGWLFFNQSGLLLKQGIYKLRIEVNDVTDPIYDSAILVDRASLR